MQHAACFHLFVDTSKGIQAGRKERKTGVLIPVERERSEYMDVKIRQDSPLASRREAWLVFHRFNIIVFTY